MWLKFFLKVPPYAAVNSTVNLFQGKSLNGESFLMPCLGKLMKKEKSLEKNKKIILIYLFLIGFIKTGKSIWRKSSKKILDIYQDEPGIDLRIKNKIDYWVEVLGGLN